LKNGGKEDDLRRPPPPPSAGTGARPTAASAAGLQAALPEGFSYGRDDRIVVDSGATNHAICMQYWSSEINARNWLFRISSGATSMQYLVERNQRKKLPVCGV
jgi:hypothetical protein